jgi:hypothetical protein
MSSQPMKLVSLKIELERYGDRRGQYTGSATFQGETGTVSLNLNEQHLDQIFATCADSIIDTARSAAKHMTMRLIEQKAAIEDKT